MVQHNVFHVSALVWVTFIVATAHQAIIGVGGIEECEKVETGESSLALQANENGSLIVLDNFPHLNNASTTNSSRHALMSSECCYDWLQQETISGLNVTSGQFQKDIVDHAMESGFRLFRRKDDLPFYASYDFTTDQFNLRREDKKYNASKRFELVAMQTFEASVIPASSINFNSSRMFGSGESKAIAENLGTDASWVYGGGRGVSFHSRYSIADVVIHVIKGSIGLVITPAENLTSLRPFPICHPLHDQSQKDFIRGKKGKDAVPAALIQRLVPGDRIGLAPLSSYRLIVLEDDTIWINSDTWSNSTILAAKRVGLESLPKYLKPNALTGQPLFFGMWSLAIYSDTLLGFGQNRTHSRNTATELKQMVMDRWGRDSVHLGHADDFRDYGLEAVDVVESIEAECLEMKQTPKDLMLSERNDVEAALMDAALKTRMAFLHAAKSATSVLFQLLVMEQMEGIISNVLGGKFTHSVLMVVTLHALT